MKKTIIGIAAVLLMVSACTKDDKPVEPVVPQDRTFSFSVENIDIFDGVAPTAAAVPTEKRLIETIIRSQELKK